MAISSTGLISGAASAAGVYLVRVIATNGDGPSAPLELAMGIEDTNFNDGIARLFHLRVLLHAKL